MKVSKSIAIDAEKLIKLQKISKEKGINLSKMIDFLIDKYFAELFAK
ncbi:MAG: ribbon-helix-helix domain-containing protein [Candidatus Thorarchaeota archaeon]